MNVRGWLIVGKGSACTGLPPQNFVGVYSRSAMPDATNFKTGQWIEWRLDTVSNVILVCVDIPV